MVTKNKDGPKLPKQQLAILAIARFAEPLAATSIYPYLPEMIKSFGVPKNEVAKWAGFTGSIFSVAQSMAAVPWGRASDRFGRKPIILLGITSTMICFILWGLSTSLTMAITVRFIMGAGNGNVGILRTMVAEMVPEKELQPKAFSLMPLVWSIGSVFGPAFGGFFAQPAKQYPSLFGNIDFFKKYPFALPNIVAGIIFFISLMTGLLFLRETLESRRGHRDWGLALGEKLTRPFKRRGPHYHHHHRNNRRHSFVDDGASAPLLAPSSLPTSIASVETDPPTLREIFTPQTIINLTSYTFLALHSVTFDQVLPVFLNYPRLSPHDRTPSNTHLPFKFSGGFGLGSDKIGTIYTVYGIACGVVQFFLFPWFCARFGVLRCFRAATLLFPIVYLLTPYTALIEDTHTRYAVFLTLILIKGVAVIIGFPCTTILLTNSASSLRILGTLNGFATTFSGLGRAIGPAMAGAIFTWGVTGRDYIIAPWWFLSLVAAIGAIPSWWIVEGEGPTRSLQTDSEESSEEEGEEEEEEEGVEVLDEGSTLVSNSQGSRADSTMDGGYGTIKKDAQEAR
ncbi:major facilitator superfamily domain-containing protein [Neurospora hispaniola]|uniref:Major facilitator superfamily domain-containing protein n=1 Tax=Neurospora hispaniola TaxID=588809 RepID=A0AAJ0MT92_9PEZI|nr:major facilitator superfamily domain-containing protein [Neurospora hispaniola]